MLEKRWIVEVGAVEPPDCGKELDITLAHHCTAVEPAVDLGLYKAEVDDGDEGGGFLLVAQVSVARVAVRVGAAVGQGKVAVHQVEERGEARTEAEELVLHEADPEEVADVEFGMDVLAVNGTGFPSPSPSPPKATHVFIALPKRRFGHYSGKAEDYRQSSIACHSEPVISCSTLRGKINKGICIIITKTVPEPSAAPSAEPKAKRTKGKTKRQSFVRESKVKQEPEVKQEPYVEQDTIIQDDNLKAVPGPAIRKKRSFSVALKEPKEPEIDIQEKELEQELSDLLFVPEEKDGVAYRMRKRHILQQEDIERSAEFGIPI
ncbi:hypothetical protein BDW68DRAFT_183105 [Aspergillus falconensis]